MPEKTTPQELEQPTGSPGLGEPVFLAVGKLLHPHGLHGEILMDVWTDFPERIRKGITLYIGEKYHPVQVHSRRIHAGNLLLGLDGYQTPESVGELRNNWVYVHANDRPPLPEGEYYHHQIIGMQVQTEEGIELGRVVEIIETGANDVYVVRSSIGREILLPAIDPVVLAIDIEQGKMIVHLLPGLIPE